MYQTLPSGGGYDGKVTLLLPRCARCIGGARVRWESCNRERGSSPIRTQPASVRYNLSTNSTRRPAAHARRGSIGARRARAHRPGETET